MLVSFWQIATITRRRGGTVAYAYVGGVETRLTPSCNGKRFFVVPPSEDYAVCVSNCGGRDPCYVNRFEEKSWMDIEFKIQSLTILYIKNFIYPVSRREKIGTNLWLPISIKIDLIHANILNLEIAIGSRLLFFSLIKIPIRTKDSVYPRVRRIRLRRRGNIFFQFPLSGGGRKGVLIYSRIIFGFLGGENKRNRALFIMLWAIKVFVVVRK